MKALGYILFCGIIFTSNVSGQNTQTEKIPNLKNNFVEIKTDYSDIKIETWNKDFIEVKSEVTINMGRDDDKHKLEISNMNKGIAIVSSIDTEKIEQLIITTDKEGNKTYTPIENWDEKMKSKSTGRLNFGYEINGTLILFVPENVELNIQSAYGDVFIDGIYEAIHTHSTYGLVEAKLNDVSNMKAVSFKSTYDIVDLTLDKRSSASLNLQTTYGSVFSDLPLESKQTNKKHYHNDCSQFSERYVLNDGSVDIDIVATYDNIYVRSYQ